MTDRKAKTTIKTELPQFDGKQENFQVWKMSFTSYLVLSRLKHYLLLSKTEPTDSDDTSISKWHSDNEDFYAILQMALDSHTKRNVVNTFKEEMNGAKTWEKINNYFNSKTMLSLTQLEENLSHIKMKEGEKPTDFISRLQETVNQIEEIEQVATSERKMITYIIKKLPLSYRSFVIGQTSE